MLIYLKKLIKNYTFFKGALKKSFVKEKDLSFGRSTLKVRWKDMIEITNVVDDIEDQSTNFANQNDQNNINENIIKRNMNDEEEIDDINDIYDDTEDSDLSEEDSVGSTSSQKKFVETLNSSEKKSLNVCKCEQLLLKPLHSTGREFEKEMNDRIEKLNRIKAKTNLYVNTNNEKIFDEIQSDLDGVLFELHSTIEHIRISSMLSNTDFTATPKSDEHGNDKNVPIKMSSKLNINEFTNRCNDFVDHSKTMINSALLEDGQMKFHLKNTMILICSLVVQCFESCYVLLYRNEKLDEIRQLLIQILNLLNTFRSSLNVTYLFSLKKLNDKNASLLIKQSTNLENDICFLIEYFKILF